MAYYAMSILTRQTHHIMTWSRWSTWIP